MENSNKAPANVKAKPRRVLPPCFSEGFRDKQLPFMKYNGRIAYCYNKDECNFLCDELSSRSAPPVLGFDMEWRVSYVKGGGSKKTSLIQLCPSKEVCYLMQLSSMSEFPVALKVLLEDEKILKVGIGIQSDVDKLSREYDVQPKGIVNLSSLANNKIGTSENWSLTGLVMHLFKQQLNKDHSIRCSNWEATPLSESQKLYAAMDAYAGLVIYKRLVAL